MNEAEYEMTDQEDYKIHVPRAGETMARMVSRLVDEGELPPHAYASGDVAWRDGTYFDPNPDKTALAAMKMRGAKEMFWIYAS